MTILFDLDGTLIDSTDAILEGFEVAFNANNSEKPNDESIKELIGYPLDLMFKTLGVSDNLIDKHVLDYKMHYRKISTQKTTLLPNAKEAIELASSFATLAVVTTKTARYSKELLEHLEVFHHFKALVGREDVTNPKPHEEPILKALNILDRESKNCFMIGDTNLDTISAKNANIKSIGVLTGYDKNLEADIIKKDALEAIEYLKSNIK